tara:strand:- start:853 stop:2337 length:1485 start_codon:yes stop_codon:yes gene_type:complete
MAVLKNRAKMSTSTTGTGTITLGNAESGYQTFGDAGVANADVVRYVIEDGTSWEIGTGTYTATGTTLTRTVIESSNSDAAIVLTGSATVFIGATAEDILSNVVEDATPQLGGNLDVQTREVTTSATNGNVKLTPNGTGAVEVKGAGGNDGTLQLNCSANSHGVKIKSPPHSAGASYTLTLPNDDGGASEFLQTNGSGVLSWATAGGGGADLYAANESSPSAQPSATGANAVAIGDSAVSAGVRSVSLQKSYASGASSFAAVLNNNTSTYGATGANSITIGYRAKAAGQSLAMGYGAAADGSYALALGVYAKAGASRSIAISAESSGYYTEALQSQSVAIGTRAKADVVGKFAFANGAFNTNGDSQVGIFSMRCDTTDATAEQLRSNTATPNTTNQVILPNNSAYFFSGTIIAREQASAGTDVGAWEIKGAIRREANAASTVLIKSTTDDFNVPTGWAVALTADTTNGGLAITVTGAAATNIRWVCSVTTSEVSY